MLFRSVSQSRYQDQIELCGVGLPEQEDISIANIRLHNLASPHSKIWQRLWSIRSNFRQINLNHFDAVSLHFALYSFPILDLLPKRLPITFNFHGPWAAESQEELLNKQLTIWIKQNLVEKNTYNQCDRFIVLSRAFGNILHQQYEIPWEKIHIIPGGVDVKHFKNNLSRLAAREQLGWPTERPILFTSRQVS